MADGEPTNASRDCVVRMTAEELVKRGDYDMDVILRIYLPDLERFKTWTPLEAERVE
jgi:hypothetical protein